MKASHLFSGLMLAVACAGAAYRANAEQPAAAAPVGAAKKQYREAEERATAFALKALQATDSDAQPEQRQGLRDNLRPLVEESFAARQQLQQAEIEALRRRLAEIEQAIGAREKNKDVIIQARIEELLSGAPVSKPVPSPTYPTAAPEATAPTLTPKRAGRGTGDNRKRAAADDGADLETEEQLLLLRIDLEAGQEELRIGKAYLAEAKKKGMITAEEIRSHERDLYEAEFELKRDQAKLDGFARRRGQLEPTVVPAMTEATGDDNKRSAADDGFDLETQERLLRIDLEAAQAKLQSAETELAAQKGLYQNGSGSARQLRASEKERQLAEIEVRRIKAKLDGFARRRTQQETAADAAFAEAAAERERAAAALRTAEAVVVSAETQVGLAVPNIETAEAHYIRQQKQHERTKALLAARAVDEKLLDEQTEKLDAARAAVTAAKSALAAAKALVVQRQSACDEARAALDLAELRVRAAQNRREQLKQRAPSDEADGERPAAAEPRVP